MAITYTYTNATNTSIKFVDDSTTPDTVKYIPVAVGNREYDALVAAGTSITAFTPVYTGYDTIANARLSRAREAEDALNGYLQTEGLIFKIRRAYATSYTMPTSDQTKIDTVYARYATFITALATETSIDAVRLSTVDYVANTQIIPAAGASGSTTTYTVTVASVSTGYYSSANRYFINGVQTPSVNVVAGNTYVFNQEDNSNSGHPIAFYTDASKTTAYTTGVTSAGTAGASGATVTLVVSSSTPSTLYYQCTNHANMGGVVNKTA